MKEAKAVLQELDALLTAARRLPEDVGREVELALAEGCRHPLSREEAARLLEKLVTKIREISKRLGDEEVLRQLNGDLAALLQSVLAARERLLNSGREAAGRGPAFPLIAHNGQSPGPVRPTPVFHGREIPMDSGFICTTDLSLWAENERLDIHLAQFKEQHGRGPTPDELLDLMLSRMELPGLPDDQKKDQFAIVGLARSIAINGVRKPPILDIDGTLLDGNRRIAACHYILNSDEFTSEQKQRVEHLFVWQLTEHATDDHREAVVVSLNFEPDHKEDWPEYVKAKKLYDHWQAMLATEGATAPGPRRQADLKKQLSLRFALGPDTAVVNRYLKMVDWVLDFEDYHMVERSRDPYEVKHRASRYFQYFDELAKGERGGVAYALRNDEPYRHLVFDLLYDGKFGKWTRIRDLRYIHENEEALDYLRKAREADGVDDAEEFIEQAGSIAKMRRAEARVTGVNTRIEVFVKWLEELPLNAFRDQVKPQNLRALQQALRLVEAQVASALGPETLSPEGAFHADE